jgi:hypothetical protein
MKHPLQQHLEGMAQDRWSRGAVRLILRAAWLSLSIWCLGFGAALVWGWSPPRPVLAAAALGLLVGGAALVFVNRRLRAAQVARRLDRRFRLNEQLSTSLEVLSTGQPLTGVAARLVEQGNRTAGQIRRRVEARTRPPLAEILALVAVVIVLLGLIVLNNIGANGAVVAPQPLPGLLGAEEDAAPPPDEPFAEPSPPPAEQPQAAQQPQPSPSDQNAAGRLADALRDQAPTRSAAEALDQGDTQGAAAELRELADQADGLGQRSRQGIADQLRGAADDLQQSDPQLADQLRRSAQGLEQGGQQASDALDDLARAVEELGQQGQQGQQGQGQQGQGQQPEPGGAQASGEGGQGQSRQAPSDRLGVEGVPLELDAEGQGDNITGNADGQGTRQVPPSDTNSSRQQSDDVVQTGDDPLRIPADLRDVVQGYFSPEE